MFIDGRLVPNTELGHVYLRNHEQDAEDYTAGRVRKDEDLSWVEWSSRLDEYFHYIEGLFSPNLIIIGGGVSKKHEKFLPQLSIRTEIVPAQLRNHAGIIGAAMWAAERVSLEIVHQAAEI